ncbi:MAG: hypothetical protein AAGM33_08715 [Pseudomonadota bacterium]
MHARKPRYDESFVDSQPTSRQSSGDADVTIVGQGNAEFVPSPARELQQQIEGRLQNGAAEQLAVRYSGRTSLLIVTSLSLLLWAGLLSLGWLVAA